MVNSRYVYSIGLQYLQAVCTDATTSAVYQNALAASNVSFIAETLQSQQCCLWNARGLFESHVPRL